MTRARRDPRAERMAAIVATTPRTRIDRTHRGGPASKATRPEPADPAPIVIAAPAFLVFAVVEAQDGVLSRYDRQVIGAARLLDGGGTGAVVVLANSSFDQAGAAGSDRIMTLDATDPETIAARIAQAIEIHAPRHVIFPDEAPGGDLARRVAALCNETLFDRIESLTARLAIRPANAGRTEWRTVPPRLLAISLDRIPPYHGTPHAVSLVETSTWMVKPPVLEMTALAGAAADIPLAEAGFVIAAGNGVTDFEGFLELARALGATPGASRMVCDAGYLPRAMQVGASGTVLNAECYIAFGISGAPQHLQGIGTVEHVVAVNTDLHAAIIARAGLSIIANAEAVMPALNARLAPGA